MDVFQYAINAILPLVLQIAAGYGFRRIGLLDEHFFRQCRKIVFYIVVPFSTFCCIYEVDSLSSIHWSLTFYCFAAVLILFGIGVLAALWVPDRRKRGVMVQCSYRSNYNIIAVPLSQALGGQAGLTAAAILSVPTIPQFNILAVIALSMFLRHNGKKQRLGAMLFDIIKNPMVIACLAGLGCLLLRQFVPRRGDGSLLFSLSGTLPFLYSAIHGIGKMSTPLALITLGGLFEGRKLSGNGRDLILGTALRTIIAPLVGLGGACWLVSRGLMQLNTGEFACLVAVFASPLATVSGVMAAQMHNDDVLADHLVLTTTVVSAFTVFAAACILRAAGFI